MKPCFPHPSPSKSGEIPTIHLATAIVALLPAEKRLLQPEALETRIVTPITSEPIMADLCHNVFSRMVTNAMPRMRPPSAGTGAGAGAGSGAGAAGAAAAVAAAATTDEKAVSR